jgi:hypothetical protein
MDESFIPDPNKDYEWVYNYAVDRVKSTIAMAVNLDAKAEVMARYVGTGSGVLGLGLSAFLITTNSSGNALGTSNTVVIMWGAVTALIFLSSIWAAMKVILPKDTFGGVAIDSALEFVSHFKTKNECFGYMSAALSDTVKSITKTLEKKKKWLNVCYLLFTIGVLFVFAGLAVLPWH